MILDKSKVRQMAQLARLHITEAEATEIVHRITEILTLVDQMKSVDTDSVEPLHNPLDAVQKLRPDIVTEENNREELQKLAPKAELGLYLVPKVLD
jgi:aspartyl-tRNA(Asn)/glutamyl-tRNA(Gln) amidotransferase subunit C